MLYVGRWHCLDTAAARQEDDNDEMATAKIRLMHCLELMFEFIYVLMCMLFIDKWSDGETMIMNKYMIERTRVSWLFLLS